MSRYDTKDMKLTNEGDFALDIFGDLATASGEDLIDQIVRSCLYTTNPDWFYDAIGTDIENLLGLSNSLETANKGKALIKASLVKTEFFDEKDIWIEAKPTDQASMVFMIFIKSPVTGKPLVYRVDHDLGLGTGVRRIQ